MVFEVKHEVFNLGGERFRVIVKVSGGAQFLDEQRTFNIGERNIEAFEEMIARNGLSVHARDTGGFNSRTMRFDLATGKIETREKRVFRITILFAGSKIRRG